VRNSLIYWCFRRGVATTFAVLTVLAGSGAHGQPAESSIPNIKEPSMTTTVIRDRSGSLFFGSAWARQGSARSARR
jgi:hypothetical protein